MGATHAYPLAVGGAQDPEPGTGREPGSPGVADSMPAAATALVWNGGSSFGVCDVPIPDPDAGTVVVAVDLATVCASDRHTVAGRRQSPAPGILGHVAMGRVVGVGPGGRQNLSGRAVCIGDRVVWSVTSSCGRCDRCRGDRRAKCRNLAKVGHQPLGGPWPLSGTYATHIVLGPGVSIVGVPDGVGDPAAALASCAVATAVAAVEAAGDLGEGTVVIRGLGALGLAAAVAARASGATRLVGVDPSPQRQAAARRLGALDELWPVDWRPSPVEDLRVVLEVSGAPGSVAWALAEAGVGARVVLAGSVAPLGTVALDPEAVVRRHLTITGVHNYEPRHLSRAVELCATPAGRHLGGLVSPAVALADLPAVLSGADPGVIRAAVAPTPGGRVPPGG